MGKPSEKKRKQQFSSVSSAGSPNTVQEYTMDSALFTSMFKDCLQDNEVQNLLGGILKDKLVNHLVAKNRCLEQRVERLEEEMEEIQQYSRRTCLKVCGVEENDKEDTDDLIIQLAEDMNVTIDKSDIGRSHRVSNRGPQKGSNKPRDIVVRFLAYNTRRKFMKNKKLLRKRPEKKDVFINEHLTKQRAEVLFHARKLRRAYKVKDCWSYDGRICLKDSSDRIRTVTRMKHLHEMYPEFFGIPTPEKKKLTFEDVMEVLCDEERESNE